MLTAAGEAPAAPESDEGDPMQKYLDMMAPAALPERPAAHWHGIGAQEERAAIVKYLREPDYCTNDLISAAFEAVAVALESGEHHKK